ncbi:hypothetical protein [Frankia sp. Mgl5]|nr:hypothetical protein [Frankia sp. Mgl5]
MPTSVVSYGLTRSGVRDARPVGVGTAVVGAPYLLWLLASGKGAGHIS